MLLPVPTRVTRDYSSPGACLDDLLASRFLPKRFLERIWSAHELPPRLRRCTEDLRPGTEWRAYGEGPIFFAMARMHAPTASEASSTAIDACFLDEHAAVYAAGVWDYDARTGWCLDAVMEPSYHPHHGWWLGELMVSGHERPVVARAHAAPPERVELQQRHPRG